MEFHPFFWIWILIIMPLFVILGLLFMKKKKCIKCQSPLKIIDSSYKFEIPITKKISILPPDLQQPHTLFTISLMYFFVYNLLIDLSSFEPTSFFGIFHVVGLIGIIYGLYFVAKSLVTLEEGKILRFDRYLGTFFLCWFFPIGIWFIQPRIKKLLSE